eukprot:11428353-Alexandrium_andersonii.AAC.1
MSEGRPEVMEATPEGLLGGEEVQPASLREVPDARGDQGCTPLSEGLGDATGHPGGRARHRSAGPGDAPA